MTGCAGDFESKMWMNVWFCAGGDRGSYISFMKKQSS